MFGQPQQQQQQQQAKPAFGFANTFGQTGAAPGFGASSTPAFGQSQGGSSIFGGFPSTPGFGQTTGSSGQAPFSFQPNPQQQQTSQQVNRPQQQLMVAGEISLLFLVNISWSSALSA